MEWSQRKKAMWRIPMAVMLLASMILSLVWLIGGSAPETSSLFIFARAGTSDDPDWIFQLPVSISHWWNIPCLGLITFMLTAVLTSRKKSENYWDFLSHYIPAILVGSLFVTLGIIASVDTDSSSGLLFTAGILLLFGFIGASLNDEHCLMLSDVLVFILIVVLFFGLFSVGSVGSVGLAIWLPIGLACWLEIFIVNFLFRRVLLNVKFWRAIGHGTEIAGYGVGRAICWIACWLIGKK